MPELQSGQQLQDRVGTKERHIAQGDHRSPNQGPQFYQSGKGCGYTPKLQEHDTTKQCNQRNVCAMKVKPAKIKRYSDEEGGEPERAELGSECYEDSPEQHDHEAADILDSGEEYGVDEYELRLLIESIEAQAEMCTDEVLAEAAARAEEAQRVHRENAGLQR